MSFGRLQQRPDPRPMGEINMTPLIDVMLVLLVIFMITAPLLTHRLPLDLPQVDEAPAAEGRAGLVLDVDAQGQIYLDDEALPPEQAHDRVSERVREAAQRDPAAEVLLRADRQVPYGRVVELIGWVQTAGVTRIGFVTQNPAP